MGKSIRRRLKSNWLSITVISILLLCLGFVFSTLLAGIQNVSLSYTDYLQHQKAEDATIYPDIEKSNPQFMSDILSDHALKPAEMESLTKIDQRLEEEGTSLLHYAKLDKLANKYHFNYEIYTTKEFVQSGTVYFLSQPMKKLDVTKIVKGHLPAKNEILVSQKSAESNQFKIGERLKIAGKKYKIIGFYYQPNQTYLYSSQSSTQLGTKKNIGILFNAKDFEKIKLKRSQTVAIKFKKGINAAKQLNKMTDSKQFLTLIDQDNNNAIGTVYHDIATNLLLGTVVSLCIFGIVIVLVIILLNDLILKLSKEIGLLIILGVSRFSIYLSLLTVLIFPMIALLIGIIFGIFSQPVIQQQITSFYNLPITLSNNYLLIGLFLLVFALLALTCGIIYAQKSRVKPILLIYQAGNQRQRKSFTRIKRLFKRLPYYLRVKLSYLCYKPAFSLLLAITVILVFNLLSFSFGLIQAKQQQAQAYEDSTSYQGYATNHELQPIAKEKETVRKGLTVTGKYRAMDLNIVGINWHNPLISGLKPLKNQPAGIILTKKMASRFHKQKGDQIKLQIENKTIKFKIVAINHLDYETRNFVQLNYLQQQIKDFKNQYNTIYYQKHLPKTADNRIVISKKKEMRNLTTTLAQTDVIITGVFVLSVIIAFSMVTLISWLSAGDNKKSISIFKRLGVGYFETYRLTTNVYTPVILLSFFFAWLMNSHFIKAMEKILNQNQSATYNAISVNATSLLVIAVLIIALYFGILFMAFSRVYQQIERQSALEA